MVDVLNQEFHPDLDAEAVEEECFDFDEEEGTWGTEEALEEQDVRDRFLWERLATTAEQDAKTTRRLVVHYDQATVTRLLPDNWDTTTDCNLVVREVAEEFFAESGSKTDQRIRPAGFLQRRIFGGPFLRKGIAPQTAFQKLFNNKKGGQRSR